MPGMLGLKQKVLYSVLYPDFAEQKMVNGANGNQHYPGCSAYGCRDFNDNWHFDHKNKPGATVTNECPEARGKQSIGNVESIGGCVSDHDSVGWNMRILWSHFIHARFSLLC